jgi:hypothetical protein
VTWDGKAPAMMMRKVDYWPGAFPVTGSVPIALLNKRMCGSGLKKIEFHSCGM